jgi:nucleoid DNA-binding protein
LLDLNVCKSESLKSIIVKCCEIWNENKDITTNEISNILGIATQTVIEYLKKGAECNLCNYNPSFEMTKKCSENGKKLGRRIICLNDNAIYYSIKEAVRETGIHFTCIKECCTRAREYTRANKTRIIYRFMYYDEYLTLKGGE